MAEVRLVNSDTGSVLVVPEEKVAGLVNLRFVPEKAPAKKAASSKSSK